jgi:hypothetical protein
MVRLFVLERDWTAVSRSTFGRAGVLGGIVAIAAYRIWRYQRTHRGRKRVDVWMRY